MLAERESTKQEGPLAPANGASIVDTTVLDAKCRMEMEMEWQSSDRCSEWLLHFAASSLSEPYPPVTASAHLMASTLDGPPDATEHGDRRVQSAQRVLPHRAARRRPLRRGEVTRGVRRTRVS
jgi:hypothetical protein